jgi:hypothetical protein
VYDRGDDGLEKEWMEDEYKKEKKGRVSVRSCSKKGNIAGEGW